MAILNQVRVTWYLWFISATLILNPLAQDERDEMGCGPGESRDRELVHREYGHRGDIDLGSIVSSASKASALAGRLWVDAGIERLSGDPSSGHCLFPVRAGRFLFRTQIGRYAQRRGMSRTKTEQKGATPDFNATSNRLYSPSATSTRGLGSSPHSDSPAFVSADRRTGFSGREKNRICRVPVRPRPDVSPHPSPARCG